MNEIKLIFVGDKKDANNFNYGGETFRPYYIISGNVDMETKNKYCKKITSQMANYNFEEFEKASMKAGNTPNKKGIIIYACLGADKKKVSGLVYPIMQDLYSWQMSNKMNTISEIEEEVVPTNYIVRTKRLDVKGLFEERGCKILSNRKTAKSKEDIEYLIVDTKKLKYNKRPRKDYVYDSFGVKKQIDKESNNEQVVQEVVVHTTFNGKPRDLEGIRVFVLKENHAYFLLVDKKVLTGNDRFYMETWYDDNAKIITADPNKARNEKKSFEIYEWGSERKD